MPRIEPIAWEDLNDEARARIEAGVAAGMYTMTLPLQIIAHSPIALRAMDDGYKAIFKQLKIGQRLQELMRLRSAQLGSCEPCSLSRKDDSLTEADVACLGDTASGSYTARERLAIEMIDRLAIDHHSIDDAFFTRLAEEFTVEEIVELGYAASSMIGSHRFMHALDILGTGEPVVRAPVSATAAS